MSTLHAIRPAGAVDGEPRRGRITAVNFLPVERAALQRRLADVEALPDWAGEFCERVALVRGNWVAWTALGELAVSVEADDRAGGVIWRVGWRAERRIALHWQIEAAPDGGARVRWSADAPADSDDGRLAAAWRDAWWQAVSTGAGLGRGVPTGPRAG